MKAPSLSCTWLYIFRNACIHTVSNGCRPNQSQCWGVCTTIHWIQMSHICCSGEQMRTHHSWMFPCSTILWMMCLRFLKWPLCFSKWSAPYSTSLQTGWLNEQCGHSKPGAHIEWLWGSAWKQFLPNQVKSPMHPLKATVLEWFLNQMKWIHACYLLTLWPYMVKPINLWKESIY